LNAIKDENPIVRVFMNKSLRELEMSANVKKRSPDSKQLATMISKSNGFTIIL
jgi:hypothetical protein